MTSVERADNSAGQSRDRVSEPHRPLRAEALRRLQSLNTQSVTAYQVVQLPRSPDDPPEGTLRLALGRAAPYGSWWKRMADYAGDRLEQVQTDGYG